MLPARQVIVKARILLQLGLADQPQPAFEHALADDLGDKPAILGLEDVRRRILRGAVHRCLAVHLQQCLFDQRRAGEVERRLQQRCTHFLAEPAGLALIQRHHRSQCTRERSCEIDHRHHGLHRMVGLPRQMHRPADRLPHSVEGHAVTHGRRGAERRRRRQDDVGLDLLEGFVIEPKIQ
ncbi:hypothetical protein SDC9_160325 [bioreactor metagenome]|uniref:Uncharacterized protein n=1 Tax=bioreactor metagenome TaxID=1076179 RepID=A0A645FF30_9ZZZZ